MNRFLLVFITILVLALGAGCDRGPTLAPLSESATILAYGDSLTYGTGASRNEAYPEVLSHLLGRTVVNAGVPGETSQGGLARLPKVLEDVRPDLVILCLGGNDFLRRLDDQKLVVNMEEMIRMIRQSGSEVVVVGVPRPGLLIRTAPLYRDLADEFKLPYEGEVLQDILTDNALKSDAVHPNAAGYRKLAEALFHLIDKAQRS